LADRSYARVRMAVNQEDLFLIYLNKASHPAP